MISEEISLPTALVKSFLSNAFYCKSAMLFKLRNLLLSNEFITRTSSLVLTFLDNYVFFHVEWPLLR